MEPAEQEAFEFFARHGFTVRPVQRTNERTPEFAVDGDGAGYLVEVKARRDDDEFVLPTDGGVYTRSQRQGRSSGVIKSVSKAVTQLRAEDPYHERLWILWLADETFAAADITVEQLRGSLLGIGTVVDLAADPTDGINGTDSFYVAPGAFERFPEIDAAVISGRRGLEPWVNEFGRRDAVLSSKVARIFGDMNDALDAEKLGLYRIDGGHRGRSREEIEEHLRNEYGLVRPVVLHFKHHVGIASSSV